MPHRTSSTRNDYEQKIMNKSMIGLSSRGNCRQKTHFLKHKQEIYL